MEGDPVHTARQLSVDDFSVEIRDRSATREELLPDWTPWDRLGVVVDRPLGSLGASAMIQLAITAFYDIRPARRAGYPTRGSLADDEAIYPEIYLFHVGGRHGFHAAFDFWPARKEVFLPTDARAVLDAVNDRAITRLLVPDADPRHVEHQWKEPAAARDRIASAFAYSAIGSAKHADVSISSASASTQVNPMNVIEQVGRVIRSGTFTADLELVAHDADLLARHWTSHREFRSQEAAEHADAARAARAALTVDGVVTEAYRRISTNDALSLLTGCALA